MSLGLGGRGQEIVTESSSSGVGCVGSASINLSAVAKLTEDVKILM